MRNTLLKKISFMIFTVSMMAFLLPLYAQIWEPIKRLTWTAGGSYYPAIATDSSDNIHVVWFDETPGNDEIYYKKSTDGGTTWSTRRLTWNSGVSVNPDIALDSNGDIHVVWQDFSPGNAEIFYQKSTDGGTSWSSKRLTWNSSSSEFPDISVDSLGDIHVVWQDDSPGNGEVFYKKSADDGVSWMTKRLTLTNTQGNSTYPALTSDSSSRIHVVWRDDVYSNWEIYYIKGIQ